MKRKKENSLPDFDGPPPRKETGAASKERPSWDAYFMDIVQVIASRAACLRRSVGAILVKDRRILATGYNGPPMGMKHCDELGGCLREKLNVPSGERHELCRALHAEQNAIIHAARHGVSTQGSILYCTNTPCAVCAKMLINAGVERVVYADGYPDAMAEEMLAEAGITLQQFRGDRKK
jgi:dCMP deaminase